MYLHQKISAWTYCVHIVLQYTFAAIEVGCVKVRDRFGVMGRFKGGLRRKGGVNNSVIINVIREINYRCNTCRYF